MHTGRLIYKLRHLHHIVLSVAVILLAGCGSNYQPSMCSSLDPEEYVETHDPFESANRSFFAFNEALDNAVLEPTARTYQKHVPVVLRNRVTDFTNFLKEPRNFVSAIMQGRPKEASEVTLRFATNAVLGIAGTIDVAGYSGVEYENHSFGDMMARWGVGDGAYFVMPFFGPSNTRDGVGDIISYSQLNVTKEISSSDLQTGVQLARVVNNRERLLALTDVVDQQPDPYIFVRESYRQNRLHHICNE